MSAAWPEFDVARDSSTIATRHLASQMFGELRVAYAPWVNRDWRTAHLYPAIYVGATRSWELI